MKLQEAIERLTEVQYEWYARDDREALSLVLEAARKMEKIEARYAMCLICKHKDNPWEDSPCFGCGHNDNWTPKEE